MAHALQPTLDPAKDAAALLRRLGFAVLMLVVPVMPFVARRGIVVLVPIGIGALVVAALIDGNRRALRDNLGRLLASRALIPIAVLVVWCGLSLVWTPVLPFATDRFVGIVATLAVALAGYVALPDRMRAANLYLLPVGTGLGAAFAILFAILGTSARAADEDGQSLERGLVVLTLMLWPAIAWLHSRQRPWDALLLGLVVALATLFSPVAMPVAALSCGALAFGLAVWKGRLGARIAGDVMGALIILAPLLPFLARPFLSLFGDGSPTRVSLDIWRRLIAADPARLITGHGFETVIRARYAGALPVETPTTLLFEIWYELGAVGAVAAGIALSLAMRHAARLHPVLLPGMAGALATTVAFACLGIGTAQIWWFTVLNVVVLAFVACERGQFHTRRPKASILTGARRAA